MRKIDKKDRQLLYELDCNSRISFADLGKRLKMTPEAIRYRFQNLQQDGVIRECFAVLDSGKLGFMQYKILLKFQSVTSEEVKEVINYARASKLALRVMQFDGPFDLNIICKVTHIDEIDRFLTALVGKFSSFIRKRSVALNVWARYLPRSYLIDKDRTKYLDRGYGSTSEKVEVDKTNRFILQKLALDARMGATEIAEAIQKNDSLMPISSFAVGKRIQNLERMKIISGYSITLNNEPIDQTMFKVLLYMNALSEADSKRFINYCLRHRHIVHIIKTFGEWDYELDIELGAIRQLHEVLMEITREFPRAVKDYVTLHYMKILKYRFLDNE